MRKPQEEPAGDTEPLEERSQRDQEQRSKQALSNQGSQDRRPADPDHQREPERGEAEHDSGDHPA